MKLKFKCSVRSPGAIFSCRLLPLVEFGGGDDVETVRLRGEDGKSSLNRVGLLEG